MIEKSGFVPLPLQSGEQGILKPNTGAAEITRRFGEFLNDAVQKLETQKAAVDQMNTQFAAGEPVDIHKLMIEAEKISLGLELTVQIRNKAIEAYQEIMRTQI